MNAIKATWKNGRIVPDEHVDWPDGCRLLVEPEPSSEFRFMTEEEQGDDPESIARWLRWYDSLEPLTVTPEEEAELAAWRQRVKDYTIASMNNGIEGLFQ